MLRMMMLGLLIPLGVGVLAAMELNTPARSVAVPVRPVAEIEAGISEPRAALAKADQPKKVDQSEKADQFEQPDQYEKPDRVGKADRLEIAAASSATPAQPALVDERKSPPRGISVGSSEPPKVINRHRHDPKPKKVAAAAPASKPKKADVKRAAISERRNAAGNAETCRLSAFGGLRRALGLAGCEI